MNLDLSHLLIIVLLLPGLGIPWVLVLRRQRLLDEAPRRLQVPTPDGATLQVFKVAAASRRFEEPVLLCHGLANNHRFYELDPSSSLVRALGEAGFDCYLVNLRGCEPWSWRARLPRDATIDDHVERDVPALVAAVAAQAGAQRAFWVGHSLGGLVALAAAQRPGLALGGLVTVGSPLSFDHGRATRFLLSLGVAVAFGGRLHVDWLTGLVAPLAGWFRFPPADGMVNHPNVAGRVQRRAMALAFSPIWRGVLRQLHDWEASAAFSSRQGQDWRAGLARLAVPLLSVAGNADLIAPPEAVERVLGKGDGVNRALAPFGKAHGHATDYGHGDLVIGKASPRDVFPVITRWLSARATARRD